MNDDHRFVEKGKEYSVSNVALRFLHKGGTKEREERNILPMLK